MIPSWMAGAIKDVLADYLTDTCTIEVQADTVDEYGLAQPGSLTTVASDVACRVIDLGTRYSELAALVADQETIKDTYRLVCPAGTALAKDQVITMSNGDVYQVVDLITERTDGVDAQAIITRRT